LKELETQCLKDGTILNEAGLNFHAGKPVWFQTFWLSRALIVLHLRQSHCKHLQATPVKVADRVTQDYVNTAKSGSLITNSFNYKTNW